MTSPSNVDEVVEAARSNRDLSTVLCDLLAERKRGFLRSTASAFVEALLEPFPFFEGSIPRAPLSPRASSESWGESLRDLALVADMLAYRRSLLEGALVRCVIDSIHRSYADLGLEATRALDVALERIEANEEVLREWMERVRRHAEDLSDREGLASTIEEGLTLDDLRRDLGV